MASAPIACINSSRRATAIASRPASSTSRNPNSSAGSTAESRNRGQVDREQQRHHRRRRAGSLEHEARLDAGVSALEAAAAEDQRANDITEKTRKIPIASDSWLVSR